MTDTAHELRTSFKQTITPLPDGRYRLTYDADFGDGDPIHHERVYTSKLRAQLRTRLVSIGWELTMAVFDVVHAIEERASR